jgi:hypothetical protein
MIRTNSSYEKCHELFVEYPLAAKAIDKSGLVHSMALALLNGGQANFFLLVARRNQDATTFSLFPWRANRGLRIGPDSDEIPDEFSTALSRGVPIPRSGSLFGWVHGEAVTALIGAQTRYTRASPVPAWAVMPLADSPAVEWPPFTDKRFLDSWFWVYYRSGAVVLLDHLIAATSGAIFWVDTREIIGSDCCAVAIDIKSPTGYTLPRGCYAASEALRAGKTPPPLALLLSSPAKTDLGPRFQLSM